MNPLTSAGNNDALAEIVKAYTALVYRTAMRLVGDAHVAEDVTQATFVVFVKKAAGIDRRFVPGWLVNTTRLTAKEALRRRATQQRHEPEAARMRSEISTPDDATANQILPLLDEALAKLSESDRTGVVMRFLQGLSFAEVGSALGMKEDAARKKVSRAVEKLRSIFMKQGIVPSVGGLMLVLASQQATTAPAAVMTSASLAAAGGTTASASLAKGVIGAMALAKVKLVAGVVLVTTLLATAGVGGEFVRRMLTAQVAALPSTQPLMAPVTTAPVLATATPIDPAERNVAGVMQVLQWDVILSKAGADAVQAIGRPTDSTSKVYQASLFNAAQLKSLVTQTAQDGRLLAASGTIGKMTGISKTLHFEQPYRLFDYWGSRPGVKVQGNFVARQYEAAADRVADDRLAVRLDLPDMNYQLIEFTGNRWRSRGIPGGQSMSFRGELQPGEALVFLGEYSSASGTPYFHLVVWEAFRADEEDAGWISHQQDTLWWCRGGLEQMRQWTAAARVWSRGAVTEASALQPWVKTLKDGKTVRLLGLSRPAEWPFCWWDPTGHPTSGYRIDLRGALPAGICACVRVDGPEAERKTIKPAPNQQLQTRGAYQEQLSRVVQMDGRTLHVGVLVGGWERVAEIQPGQSVEEDGVLYQIDEVTGETEVTVQFKRTGVLREEVDLSAVDNKGRETSCWNRGYAIRFGPRDARVETEERPMHFQALPPADVKFFRIWKRQWQWVTFENVAIEPVTKPRTVVSAAEVIEIKKEAQRRAEEAEKKKLADQRKQWRAIPATQATAMGTLRLLADAGMKHDETKVRQLLATDSPKLVEALDTFAAMFVAQHALYEKCVKRFGEDATRKQLEHHGLGAVDVEAMLFSMPWKPAGEGLQNESLSIRKDQQGQFRVFVVDSESVIPADALRMMMDKVQSLDRLLTAKPDITIEEFKKALEGNRPENP